MLEPKKLAPPAIAIAISAVLILLGLQLCSVGHFSFEQASSVTAQIGTICFWVGLFGLGIGFLWLLVRIIRK